MLADFVRSVISGLGVLLLLIIVKVALDRWRERKAPEAMVPRPSAFGLLAFGAFAFGSVLDQALRFGESVTWRLYPAIVGLACSLLAARSMFTFAFLAKREARLERLARDGR